MHCEEIRLKITYTLITSIVRKWRCLVPVQSGTERNVYYYFKYVVNSVNCIVCGLLHKSPVLNKENV